MKTKFLDAILAAGLLWVVCSGFAHTWENVNNSYFLSIGMSADGRILYAVSSGSHPRISADSGKTWLNATNSPLTSGYHFESIAISADGRRIFMTGTTEYPFTTNGVSLSTDYGTNWTRAAFPTIANTYHVACSADGSRVIAATENGPIYFSMDAGQNCSTSSVPDAAWTSVASSADGGRMVAAAKGGSIYLSENFGETWMPADLPDQSWASVCISADGKSIGATSGLGSYISRDIGFTWLTNEISGRAISCSADGTSWVIAGEQIYISIDGAATWQTNFDAGGYWFNSIMSADGCTVLAVPWDPGIFLGRVTPSPQLNIQPQDSAVTLSWLLPSTNFLLQQSCDLAMGNWTAVSNTPTLNFTNLQQEVTVPTTESNAFFRLMAQ